MAEALNRAKTEVGTDAVVLRTQQVTRKSLMGLRTKVSYRLTVGRDLPRPRRPQVAPVRRQTPASERPTSRPAPAAPKVARPGEALMGSPVAQTAQLKSINSDVARLSKAVESLATLTHKQLKPDLPEGLQGHYLDLLENEVCHEVANRVVEKLRDQCRPGDLTDPQFAKMKLCDYLTELVPTSGPITRTKTTGPHVVALVGPTGVGKTTTVAKLAANLKLREGHSVGLITVDTFRMGAVDQLKKYSDIIGSRLAVVATPDDLGPALRSLADCDYVLIDTAGRSPRDKKELARMKRVLEIAKADEVHLVLAAASGRKQLDLITDRFAPLGVDKVIFTKLDEAAQLGVMLNVALKLDTQLSYVTHGQEVPNDIQVSDARRIAQMILGDEPDPYSENEPAAEGSTSSAKSSSTNKSAEAGVQGRAA